MAQGHWLDKLASAQADHVADLVVDGAGNSYVIGDLSLAMQITSGISTYGSISTSGGRDAFVAKFTSSGALLWTRRAGGSGVDVGLKLVLGPAGLGVTGIFTGTADLFGSMLSAQGGGTDVFVALLDTATGAAQWVRSMGGPLYTDTPGGITATSSGDIVVVGKFKGSAIFGTDTLHSAFDPWTMALGFDAFIASWSATGVFQWVQQGSGPHDDEAVDVVSDPNDMLYVTGQFSDTITFDAVHPNISLNSMFVVKFDALGNEQWFRKCGGSTFNHISDLRWSNANDLLMTGDVANTMFWVASSATAIPNTYPNAYFILRVDAAGNLIRAQTMGSDSPVHAVSITEQADSVVVYGEFQCSFTGLQTAYNASGLFMATGLKDLFIAKHRSADLVFVEAQQFGGSGAKRAGAIASLNDELLFAGSFDGELFLPREIAYWGEPVNPFPSCSYTGANSGLTYCDDPAYGYFAWARGMGLADGFLAKGYVEERQPYDFWMRQGTPPCDRSDRSAAFCINALGPQCPDSVTACGSVDLYSVVPFARKDDAFCPNGSTIGPAAFQSWNFGWPANNTTAYVTGWYVFAMNSANGCYLWQDSIHVTINPVPSARVSDSSGVFLNSALPPMYQSCDTMVIWATQYAPTDLVYWTVGQDTTWNDTIRTNATAIYRLHIVSANGCRTTYAMSFTLIATPPFPNITGALTAFANGDTTSTCSATCAGGQVAITWLVNGVPTTLPFGFRLQYQFAQSCNAQNPPGTTIYVNSPVPFSIPINGVGWYLVQGTFVLNDLPCDTNTYTINFSDSIFVFPGQPPQFTSANTYRCVGDTVPINFHCTGCDSVVWNGPGIVWISANGDSVRVDQNGYYYFTVYHTSYGNTCHWTSNVGVFAPPPPPIFSAPANGIICPNDSVLLYTYGSYSGFEWSGPGAVTLPSNDSIWVDEPGDYYLTVTLYPGCTSTNGPRTVLNFSSPFIEALPTGTICVNGSIDLHVVAGNGSTVQWQSPLSGNGLVQTVTSPGTYHAVVSSCGINWELEYLVQMTSVLAELDTTSYFMCENAPLVLTAPPGGDIYQWLPTGTNAPQFVVTSPGTYQLIVIDAFGCGDTSSVITVVPHTFGSPTTVVGDTACAGTMLVLQATGSGDLLWYATPDTSEWLASGNGYTTQAVQTDTIYVLQVEDGCPGLFEPVVLLVEDAPEAPSISGDRSHCSGDTLLLQAVASGSPTFVWGTPIGQVNGPTIGPVAVDVGSAGTYNCFVVGAVCNSDTTMVTVTVNPVPELPLILGDTLLCVGDTLVLSASTANGDAYWSTPVGIIVGDPLIVPSIGNGNAGTYACLVQQAECKSDTAFIVLTVSACPDDDDGEIILPNIVTPNGDGVNDVFVLSSERLERIELEIYNRWGQLVAFAKGRYVSWDGRATLSGEPCSDGVYYYIIKAVTITHEPFDRNGYVHLKR